MSVGWLLLILAVPVAAKETAPKAAPGASSAAPMIEDEARILRKLRERGPREKAIEKAVLFLLSQQNKDGSFGPKIKNALTGLALMALMASGYTPDHPTKGAAVRRGLNYVLSQMRKDGYLGASDNSRMYGHGICTLMLSEAAGMSNDPLLGRRLIEACRRAVQLILRAQAIKKSGRDQGGWRYHPTSRDSDLSLTGWQTMSLRAAKNIGIKVPSKAIQDAVKYIRAMAHPNGGFGYHGPGDSPVLRGIGLLALPVCGVYDAPELAKSTARMLKDPPRWRGPFFYYRTYYAMVGMYQMGDRAWRRFYPGVDQVLLKHQQPDGRWAEPPGNRELNYGGYVYTTSMAVLALAVHYHLLPIYQR